jgi:hypothetical protein
LSSGTKVEKKLSFTSPPKQVVLNSVPTLPSPQVQSVTENLEKLSLKMMSDYKAIPKEARKSEKEMHNFC